jgi:hypothetical protein
MSEYRNRTTGEVKTQGQWRAANPNMSLPRVWNSNVCDALDLDPVLASPKPSAGQYETVRRNGVTQDANGNWVEAYEVVSMFNEYTDDDGVTHTVAEQEAAYQARLDEQAAERNRTQRNTLLAETDWMALTDVTMSAEMTAYRQALRDITSHANWPNLEEADWPTKPE